MPGHVNKETVTHTCHSVKTFKVMYEGFDQIAN